MVFRSALFTQSLYLAACVCIALFFRFFFRAEWMRYVLWGGWFLAIYGIYEWLFFLIFKQPGDFIVNRTYGDAHGKLVAGNPGRTIQPVAHKIHVWRAFLVFRGGHPLYISCSAIQAEMALCSASLLYRFLHLQLGLRSISSCFAPP